MGVSYAVVSKDTLGTSTICAYAKATATSATIAYTPSSSPSKLKAAASIAGYGGAMVSVPGIGNAAYQRAHSIFVLEGTTMISIIDTAATNGEAGSDRVPVN